VQLQHKRILKIMLYLGVIVLLSIVSMVSINAAFAVTDLVYDGVKVGNVDVGGLSEKEAQKKLEEAFWGQTNKEALLLTYKDQKWTIATSDIDLTINSESLAHQAYLVGRSGNIVNKIKEKFIALHSGHTIPIEVSYDNQKLSAIILQIASSINQNAQNAGLIRTSPNLTVLPERIGVNVNIDATLAAISTNLSLKLPATIPLPVQEIVPTITSQDLEGIEGIIGSYTTQFDATNNNRTINIKLAAKSITDVLVRKNEVFSFNEYVGLRLAEHGYKEAPVFIEGKLVPDWGGGVCQVSSTLYNAVLLADLGIEERTSHFRPPGYVPLGQDATVADNQLDFKFRNTSSNNIYITTELTYGQLTVYIYGKPQPNAPNIEIASLDPKVIEPNTIVKQDPNLELGKKIVEVEGQKGFIINTYRIKYLNGKEIHREFLATDEFPVEDSIVIVGTKVPDQKNK